jgi:high-affinity iron transporter
MISAIIFIMGLTMLRIDRSKIKWRLKLEHAFDTKGTGEAQSQQRGGKWTLFLIPLITVLREGLEAVVFVGGVRLLLHVLVRIHAKQCPP